MQRLRFSVNGFLFYRIPMWTALSWRFGLAALIFWVWVSRQNAQLTTSDKRSCFFIGFLGDTCRTTLFFLTISKLGASLASLLLFTFPFFVFLWQRLVFQQPATKFNGWDSAYLLWDVS